jgi:hypothetical protein
MTHFVGLDVSVKETSVCVVDGAGEVLCERKVLTEPDDIAVLLTSIGGDYVRVGIEAGPLSQWLMSGLAEAGLPMVCVETRHMKALLKAQQINKSDRNDARGIAQMMRVGLFKPVHVKTLAANAPPSACAGGCPGIARHDGTWVRRCRTGKRADGACPKLTRQKQHRGVVTGWMVTTPDTEAAVSGLQGNPTPHTISSHFRSGCRR